MYCEFFGFREKPFNITPNPRFIFLSKKHREAFAHLLYGIDNHSGFIELTGEVGTGKTTILRTLLEQLDERGHRTALIFNPRLSAEELMKSINREFGIAWEGLTNAQLLDALNRFLLSENAAGRTVVLVIDEAQNLDPLVLEQVRLISNLETKTDKLIQIVLAGQPELAQLLNRPELRQIAQRITVSYHLTPLDGEDATAYIEHRLEVAGDWRAAVFTPQALKRVFRYTGGVPRLINIVCDRALLFGYIEESREISVRMVNAAISEIRREGSAGKRLRARLGCAVAAVVVIACLIAFRQDLRDLFPPPAVEAVGDVTGKLAAAGEAESALHAFNTVIGSWKASPVEKVSALQFPRDFVEQAGRRGLKLTRHSSNLGALLRMNYPAILEISPPGVAGKRYVALTGLGNGRLNIAAPQLERGSLTTAELEAMWSGTAYILWKDFHAITGNLTRGARGKEVEHLQRLLKEARLYPGEITGYFGEKTVAALKKFQQENRLDPDGTTGAQTLPLLYLIGGNPAIPVLAKQKGNEQG